jgi:hypothetical protein
VFAFFKAHQEARALQVEAYRETLGEALASGLVSVRELHLLDSVRANLDITDAEHKRVLQSLTEAERNLLDPARAASAERRLQLAGYQAALAAAVLRDAPHRELETIRTDYGIRAEEHAAALAELHGESSLLRDKVAAEMERIHAIRAQILGLVPLRPTAGALELVVYVLLKEQDRAVDRVVRLLALLGDEDEVQRVAEGLFADDKRLRRTALVALRAAAPAGLVDALAPVVLDRRPKPEAELDPAAPATTLRALATSADPYLRASAVLTMGELGDEGFRPLLLAALEDEHELVRDSAARATALVPARLAAPISTADGETHERSGRHAVRPVAAPPTGEFATLGALGQMLFLRRVPLLVDLDPADLHDFSAIAREEQVAPPQVLCRQGERGDDLFIVVEGRAEVVVEEDGRERVVAELGPGEVVGELGALDRSPRSATVRPAGGPIRVLRIPGDEFRQRLASRPDLAPTLMTTLSRRLRQSLRQSSG